jgi:hypothetical protein
MKKIKTFFRQLGITILAFIPAMILPHPGWNDETKDKDIKK